MDISIIRPKYSISMWHFYWNLFVILSNCAGEVERLMREYHQNQEMVRNIGSHYYQIIYPVQLRHHEKMGISTREVGKVSKQRPFIFLYLVLLYSFWIWNPPTPQQSAYSFLIWIDQPIWNSLYRSQAKIN